MVSKNWAVNSRYWCMVFCVGFLFLIAFVVLLGFVAGSFEHYPAGEQYFRAVLHIVPGIGWFAFALIQVTPSLRHKYPLMHRVSGYLALLSLFASGAAVIYMMIVNDYLAGGYVVRPMGILSAIYVLVLAFLGWRFARLRDFERHRDMMIRLFATMLMVPLQRPINLVFFAIYGADFAQPEEKNVQLLGASLWLSWIVGMALGEVYLSWQYKRGMFSDMFHRQPSQLAYPLIRLDNWTSLVVAETSGERDSHLRLRLALPSAKDVLVVPPSHHLYVRTAAGVRPYTPVAAGIEARGHVELLIKVYPDGAVSTALAKLQPGDTLDVRGPVGSFEYEPGASKHIGMIAGGSGITPMLSVASSALADEQHQVSIKLMYVVRNKDDVMGETELDALVAEYPGRFTWATFLTADRRPDAEAVKAGISGEGSADLALVCGPPRFNRAMITAAKKAGFKDYYGFGTSDR